MSRCAHPNVVLAAPTWSLNGPNVFSANLARGLIARQIPAHIVLTRPNWFDCKPLPRPADVPFQELPVDPFMPLGARWKAMIRHLQNHAPCIYIPNYDFMHSCVSPMLPDCISIVGVAHSDDPQHYEHVRRLGKYWNAVTAVSATIRAEISTIAPSVVSRLSLIPYGVATSVRFPARSSETGRSLRLIYAGRLDQPQKRVLDLPKIVKAAANLGVPIQMTIAGSGPAESALRSHFAGIGAGSRVEFVGTVNSSALSGMFAEHDVFLLASEFEGLPISLLEAMGQGCIPLVTDIRSGIPELVEDRVNGFRVPVGDVQTFARRLLELFHNPRGRLQMGQAAHRAVRTGPYELEHMVDSYVELFVKVQEETHMGAFRRPKSNIQPPPNLLWQEHLPGPMQRAGRYCRRLLAPGRR